MLKRRPSIERLRDVLKYNKTTGVLTWRASTSTKIKIGDIAGSKSHRGYILVRLDGQRLAAHHVAFAIVMGRWPDPELDHKDTKRDNNRWRNLREATTAQNAMNRRTRSDNKLGLKGVTRHKKNFQAQIRFEGSKITIGTFPTPEAAHAAYAAKAAELFGKFARAS